MGKNYDDMKLRDRIIRDVGSSRIPCDNIPPITINLDRKAGQPVRLSLHLVPKLQ